MIDRDYYLSLCIDAQKNLEYYKTEAERKVIKWEYTSGKRYDITPFWFERNQEPVAKVRKQETSSKYGLDESGNVWVAAFDSSTDIIGYRSQDEQGIINRLYRSDGRLDSIQHMTIINGLPTHYVEFIVRMGSTLDTVWHYEEHYKYEDRMLNHISREYWSNLGPRGRQYQVQYNYEFHISYDEDGSLSQIHDNHQKIIYVRMSKQKVIALREEVKTGLVEDAKDVFQEIHRKTGSERLCFVAIYLHQSSSYIYDPVYHPGLERIRTEQLEQKLTPDILWSSGEHPSDYQESIQNEELGRKLERLVQYWQMKNNWWKEGKRLWYDVVQELNLQDWSGILPITDDFVIYVDEEALNVKKGDLAKSIPSNKVDVLYAKGLLSTIKK
ncbi:hypothetical protein ACFQ88_26360 [Paenibacillus sp. NPDC056579]|uniref:hypothetical protein n=1 Tax=Paenibacillus sp. NPDC056579 TaxID=3345871 RepID=UPI0036A46490